MRPKQLLVVFALVVATVLAGCTASGLSLSDAEEGSSVIDDVSMQVERNGSVSLTVVYEDEPTIEEEDCYFNPATKTTMCDYHNRDVNISNSTLVLATGGEEGEQKTVEPVARDGRTVTFQYKMGGYTEVTIKSQAVGTDGYEWGATGFGFEVDPASQRYVVENSTWYSESF